MVEYWSLETEEDIDVSREKGLGWQKVPESAAMLSVPAANKRWAAGAEKQAGNTERAAPARTIIPLDPTSTSAEISERGRGTRGEVGA